MIGMPFKAQTELIAVQGVKVADAARTDLKHQMGGLKSAGHVRHSSLIRMICKGNYPAISPRPHRAVSIEPSIQLNAIQLSPSFDSFTSRPELDSQIASPRIVGQERTVKPITLLKTPQKSLVKAQLRVIRVRKRASTSSILSASSASDRTNSNRLKQPLTLLRISSSGPRKVTLVRNGDLVLSPS